MPATSCNERRDNNQIEVRFRNGQPIRLDFYAARAKPDPKIPGRVARMLSGAAEEELVLTSDKIATAMLPGVAPGCVAFSASAFAKRELVVQFDENGQLARVDQITDSSAAAIAAALAAASTTFRDEYATSLSKAVEVQDNKRKLELGDLTTRIDALTKQRELIDAQTAADSAGANVELTLRRQQLAAELAELEAKTSLQTAQETADQRVALEALKNEVALLKQELELMKAKQDLAAARKGT